MAAVTAAILASAAAGVFGASRASSAAKHAADVQSAAATASAADVRRERDRYAGRFAPYAASSDAAMTRISDSLLRNSGHPLRETTGPGYGQGSNQSMPLGQSMTQASGQTWAVRAPDGEVRMVPPAIGMQAVQRGGVRVG